MKIVRFLYLSSLHVALATGVLTAAFFRLTGSAPITQWVSLLQIVLTCWLVYIMDRVLDVIRGNAATERHRFHFENQYNLQILAIALMAINASLLFFQSKEIIIYGLFIGVAVIFYLAWIVPRHPGTKDFFMPMLYLCAVVGVPFVQTSSIALSAWVTAFMFALLVFQNLNAFAYFEQEKTTRRKAVTFMGAVNLFIFLLLFSGNMEYPNRLALIITAISLFYSLIINNKERFAPHYRWLMDVLLFLPLLIL